MINLMISDDHKIVREGIKQLLELEGDYKVLYEAGDGDECLKILKEKELPQVLLLDINMPKKNGLEVLEEIHKKKIKVKVIILSVHDEIEYLTKAVDIGIDGYVLKDSDLNILTKAINCVLNDESYIQPELIPELNARLMTRAEDQQIIDSLTRRELEILKLLAIGKFNREIATELIISERTVKNHISNIFKKLGVADRTQAAVFAIRNDLIDIY